MVTSKCYEWRKDYSSAYKHLKDELSRGVLVPFQPAKEITLTCDASPTACGAVLEQEGKPVLFISKTLAKAERNYSQLDREALAMVYALKRLHKYLYGRPFTIVTDHMPLEYFFKPSGTKASHANQRHEQL